jgi:hypothetical protein
MLKCVCEACHSDPALRSRYTGIALEKRDLRDSLSSPSIEGLEEFFSIPAMKRAIIRGAL